MRSRLYRSSTDKMVAGVCGGLARWLEIDATLVRIFFALLGILTGIGFALYLVLWIILPYEGAGRAGDADTAMSGAAEVAQQARTMGDDLRDSSQFVLRVDEVVAAIDAAIFLHRDGSAADGGADAH